MYTHPVRVAGSPGNGRRIATGSDSIFDCISPISKHYVIGININDNSLRFLIGLLIYIERSHSVCMMMMIINPIALSSEHLPAYIER